MELCKSLRWKGFHSRDWSSPEELIARLVQPEVPFSCLRTCQPWGPDDGPSAPGDCASHRSCFEPSDELPQRRAPLA
jgi:hypothetical protein